MRRVVSSRASQHEVPVFAERLLQHNPPTELFRGLDRALSPNGGAFSTDLRLAYRSGCPDTASTWPSERSGSGPSLR